MFKKDEIKTAIGTGMVEPENFSKYANDKTRALREYITKESTQ